MTNLRTPRFWLLTTAALIFGSHMTAAAQGVPTYQTGAPTMVAAAPGLPSVPAEQIARDVITEFNPRTGTRELVAANFDPFEEDPTLAGSLRLRSADGAVSIDGRPLRDGALVEVDFYYNSPSDDPYGGRNYSDVSFINGELAPVVLRDTRILECSTRVDNVVYDHVSYYDRSLSSGIYRPYRHYAGHSSFGFGYGSNYYGPGYGYYDGRSSYNGRSYSGGRSSYRNSRNRRSGTSRPSTHSRVLDAVRNRDGADSRGSRNETNETRTGDRNDTASTSRGSRRGLTDRDIDERLSRVQSYGTGRTRDEATRNSRGVSPMRAGVARERIVIGVSPEQSSTAQAPSSGSQAGERRQTRQTRSGRNNAQRSETPRAEPSRSEPRRQSNSRSNTQPKKRKSSTRSRRNASSNIKRQLNFFPNDGYGGRSVVSSRSVDCAREDKLRVFIPNDRLDAARFDGLTIIAFDAQGGETPIYLPPNYIEGFRMAATGRVRPQGSQSAPQTVTPQYSGPQYSTPVPGNRIEAAPCPTGTLKQVDGTCLQTGSVGYPTR